MLSKIKGWFKQDRWYTSCNREFSQVSVNAHRHGNVITLTLRDEFGISTTVAISASSGKIESFSRIV